MDYLLLILGGIAITAGLAGSVLPIPGPLLSFAGMLAIHFSKFAEFTSELLTTLGVASLIITLLDFYIPVWGTKKFGGSKLGSRGSLVGVVFGIFLGGPLGIFIGAFGGAFLGEMLNSPKLKIALKAAFGSFLGFLSGIFIQIAICIAIVFFTIKGISF